MTIEYHFTPETLLSELELDRVRRLQLEVLDEVYFCAVSSKPIVEMISSATGDETYWVERTSFLQLMKNDDVLYDTYMYGADSGIFFEAGTTKVVAEIIQRGLEVRDEAALQPIVEAHDLREFEYRNYTLSTT